MKKITRIISLIFLLFFAACHLENDQQKTEFISAPKDTTPPKDYSNVVFATKKDTTCGMPLSAGIGDTLHWKGKVYGFCSKQCKDAFVARLKKDNKME